MSESLHCSYHDAKAANCGLTRSILGTHDPRFARVQPDACKACLRSFEPTADTPNPVVASLVFGATFDVEAEGGVEGCDVERALELRDFARQYLHFEDGKPRVDYLPGLQALDEHCSCVGEDRAPLCAWCTDCSPANDPALPKLRDVVPSCSEPEGDRIKTWAAGVVTAPRRRPTLSYTLDSIIRAGWPAPHIFSDGEPALDSRHRHLSVTVRTPASGAWPNFFLALSELFTREPHADAYLICEDDALFYDRENVREYLEDALRCKDNTAFFSLYCSMAYDNQGKDGWHEFDGAWRWGALAFVFPRRSLLEYLSDKGILHHASTKEGHIHSDVLSGLWAHHNQRKVYYPTPSLVQHIGDVSAVWKDSHARAERRALRFVGDSFFESFSPRTGRRASGPPPSPGSPPA